LQRRHTAVVCHKFSICIELAEAVAKSGVLQASYDAGSRPAKFSFTTLSQGKLLSMAMTCSHAPLPNAVEPIVEYKNVLAALECFSKTKELHRVAK